MCIKKTKLNLVELTEYFERDTTMTLEANGRSTKSGKEMTILISYNGSNLILEVFVEEVKKEEIVLTSDKYDLSIDIGTADRPTLTLKDKVNDKILLHNIDFKSNDFFTS